MTAEPTGTVIAHGVDLVEIDRVRRLLDEHGARFVDRCFTPGEQAYAEQSATRRAERYAVRFACKEAVLKALGTGWRDGITWRDIDVLRSADGRPGVRLSGRCAELARARGIAAWHVSLSHTGGLGLAGVIACGAG